MQNATTAPALHDLNIGDAVRATITGPWWTGRQLEIVGFKLDGDIAIVRELTAVEEFAPAGAVSVPANLLVRI